MTVKPAWATIVCGAVNESRAGKFVGQLKRCLRFNFWIVALTLELDQRRADEKAEIVRPRKYAFHINFAS